MNLAHADTLSAKLRRSPHLLIRALMGVLMGICALPAFTAWDKPAYPVIFIHGLISNAQDSWGDFVSQAGLPSNGWTYGGTFYPLGNGNVKSFGPNQSSVASSADFYT